MGWLLACIRMLLFGSCTGQAVLATLLWAKTVLDPQNDLITFVVASYLLAVAQLPAAVWKPQNYRSWLALYVILVLYLLAASLFVAVKWSMGHGENILVGNPLEVSAIAALALVSVFLLGFTISYPTEPTQSPGSDPEKGFDTHRNSSESVSVECKSADAHSEELSLNKSHQVAVPPVVAKPLTNKDSEKTLVARNPGAHLNSEEEFDAATVSWLVHASMSQQGLDDHLGENWMTARLHQSVAGYSCRIPDANNRFSHSSHEAKSGLGRSNTTGQLQMKKSRRVKTRTSSVSLTSREAFYPSHYHRRSLELWLKHEGNHSTDSGAKYLLKTAPGPAFAMGWAHNPSASQSTTQYTGPTLHRSSQSTLPKFADSEQFRRHSSIDQASAIDYSIPNTPEDNQFFITSHHSPKAHSAVSSMGEIMEGLEEIKSGVPKWSAGPASASMKNISLQEWERKKHSWLACEHEVKPIVYYANMDYSDPTTSNNTQNMDTNIANDRLLVRSFSAPSLHTYRPVSEVDALGHSQILTLEPTPKLAAQNYTLVRAQTPPALPLVTEISSVTSSPIKKIMNFIKRDSHLDAVGYNSGSTSSINTGHKHTSSVTASMVSATSGKSSRSGLPRKGIKSLFSRTSVEQPVRASFAFAMTPRMSPSKNPTPLLYSKPKIPPSFRYQDWEADTLDGLDRSRVSSVPSAVIGEYDKEKWRTLKELQRHDEV